MKKSLFMISVITITLVMMACSPSTTPGKVKLKTYADSLSYALGHVYGSDIADTEFDFNLSLIFKGLVNAKDRSLVILTDEQISELFERFQGEMMALNTEATEPIRIQNQTEGKAYMAMNAADPNVKTHESGIQYKVLKSGSGRRLVRDGDTVTARYTGRFLDGTVFDSTDARGDEPMTFDISLVIEGWNEGLKLMRAGDIFEFVIPDYLAYGEMGYGIIEPGAYLIFEVELISIR